MNLGTQRRALVSQKAHVPKVCGVPKGTSRDEATSNSKKKKKKSSPALAVIELHLSEDIRQLVS